VDQLPKLLGFPVKADGVIPRVVAIAGGVAEGHTNAVAALLGGGTLVVILALKRFVRVPGILIPVAAATLAVGAWGLDQRFGVKVLGSLPRGLPTFQLPLLGLNDIGTLATAALAIAVVSFADTSVLSRVYAAKQKTHVDPNQEMFALGVANVSAGLFQGFPMSS